MGAACSVCTKAQGGEPLYDSITRENQLLDSLIIPIPKLTKLKYLNDFQNKFNILKYFQLVDFINLLNNFRPDSNGENSSHSKSFQNSYLNKEDWIRFTNSKIIKSPLIPEFDSVGEGLLSQFYDDVFDKLLRSYKFFYNSDSSFIPKTTIISFAFNYCGMKVSQKIDIFFNLFKNAEGKISFKNDAVYAFLYCMIIFAFDFPTEFLKKFNNPEYDRKYYGINSAKDFEEFESETKREEIYREFFNKETKKIFGENEEKTFDKDDFKKLIMDTSENGATWIIDNGLLRNRMEECMEAK